MTDPVSATTAVLTSFAHANNIIKAIVGVRDATINLEQVNDLRGEINSIQSGYFALLQQNTSMLAEIDNLKKQIAGFEQWDREAIRYKLTQIKPGVFAYALKESCANDEPPHWICADCHNNRKKFILSNSRKPLYHEYFKCSNCNFSANIPENIAPSYA
jgi:hypothetical protein